MTPPEPLRRSRYVILTTYRRDGRAVSTILGCAVDECAQVCMLTRPGSGKVKRIANNAAVVITPCDGQGRPKGLGTTGTARAVTPDETARSGDCCHVATRQRGWPC